MADIAILGSGGWGMAMAVNQLQNGHTLTLWSPYEEEIECLRKARGNARLLPGVVLPEQIGLTTDLSCAEKADICVIAVPSGAVRSVAAALRGVVSAPLVVSLAKGIENGSFMRMSEVILSELPGARVTVLSGPSHAEEVARGIPTLCVVASQKLEDACHIQDEMMNPTLRLYTSTDLAGVELGGAIKNVMALAVGMLDGMGMGDNTKAALMTRGITEMMRLGVAFGGQPETFTGLTGIGDLIVTCISQHSRNKRAGVLIGSGMTPEDAVAQVGTVEGYTTTKAVYAVAKELGIEIPIVEAIHGVLYEGEQAMQTLDRLMRRNKKHENEQEWFKGKTDL